MTVDNENHAIPLSTLIVGTVIFAFTLVAWLYASSHGIDPGPLWVLVGPIIGALFLGNALNRVASNAGQAAVQTNGMLDARIQTGVANALAARDASRAGLVNPDASLPQTAAGASLSNAPAPFHAPQTTTEVAS